jgi:AraC-like DNA-binding protein
MGFACVSVPVPADQGVSLVATAGPFIPAEAPHSAHADATDGLERLRLLDGEPHPCTLDDIAVTPVSAAHACAEWLADDLAALYAREVVLCETAVPKEEGTAGGPLRARKPSAATRIGAEAAMCAAAVAGDWVGLRKTLGVALQVDAHSPLTRLQRARALRVAATVLEAAESTNTPGAATCRSRLTALGEELSVAESGRALLSAVLAFLKPLKGCSKGGNKDQMLTVLHAAVSRDVAQSVSLEDIARELGVHPTAVTHRLQRTLGLSYTEYVGQLRVEKAKELLRRTQLGVGEVGRRVGIDDPSNFAKLFRRHEGISPGDYRKNRGKRL